MTVEKLSAEFAGELQNRNGGDRVRDSGGTHSDSAGHAGGIRISASAYPSDSSADPITSMI